jgi:Outer membrane protein beta-barrel family
MKNKIILLLSLIAFKANSQGKVVGLTLEDKNIPASFATVSLLSEKDSTNIKSIFSDENGKFQFEGVSKGKFFIGITYIGFSKTISSKFEIDDSNLQVDLGEIFLKKDAVALQEVTVKAQRKVIEREADRFVMNVAASSLASSNLLDLFRATPFMNVQGKTITFRGKSSLLVLVDNRPIPVESLGAYLESMTGGEIEKIEFITNPSSRYDASVDGVINIITKKGLKQGLIGSIRANGSQGIAGNTNWGGNFTYRQEKFALFGRYGYINSGSYEFREGNRVLGFQSPNSLAFDTEEKRVGQSQIHSTQLGLDLFLHKNHTLGFIIDGNFGNSKGTWDSNIYFRKNTKTDSTLSSPSLLRYNSIITNYSLNYKGVLDSKGREVNAIFTYSPIDIELNTQLNEQVLSSPANQFLKKYNPIRTNSPSKYNIFIGQVDFMLPIEKNWKTEVGLKISSSSNQSQVVQDRLIDGTWKNSPQYTFNNDLTEQIASGYANVSKNIKKTFFRAGLRVENTQAVAKNVFDYNFTNLFPSVLLQQSFSQNYQVTLDYRKKIIRPSYSQLLPYVIVVDQYTSGEGNLSLRPQYSNVVSITNSFKNSTYVTLDYTHSKGQVLELPYLNGNSVIWKQQNLDLSQIYTANIYNTKNIKPWWQFNNYVWGGYYSAKGLIDNKTTKINGLSWTFATSSTFTLPKEFKIDAYFSYDSPYIYGIFETPARNFTRIAVRKTAMKKQAEFTLAVDDIFRGNYYGTAINTNVLALNSKTYQDSRRISVGFTYQLGKRTVEGANPKSLGNEDVLGRTQKR